MYLCVPMYHLKSRDNPPPPNVWTQAVWVFSSGGLEVGNNAYQTYFLLLSYISPAFQRITLVLRHGLTELPSLAFSLLGSLSRPWTFILLSSCLGVLNSWDSSADGSRCSVLFFLSVCIWWNGHMENSKKWGIADWKVELWDILGSAFMSFI